MKKFLKGVVGYFLGTAMFVYTACIFMEPNLLPVFVLMDAICALILFLIFRKRKPKPAKQKAPPKTEPNHAKGRYTFRWCTCLCYAHRTAGATGP